MNVKDLMLGALFAAMVVFLGMVYLDWYDNYHGELNAVMDCETKMMDEYDEAGVPLRMGSRELFDHCASEVLAARRGE